MHPKNYRAEYTANSSVPCRPDRPYAEPRDARTGVDHQGPPAPTSQERLAAIREVSRR